MKDKYVKKSSIILLTIVFAISVVLAACSSNTSSSENTNNKETQSSHENNSETGDSESQLADKQVLRLPSTEAIKTMDSSKTANAMDMETLANVEAGLLMYNGDDEIVPDLAKELPKTNDDNTKYTFKLRDAKWSDGSPITADQFVYSWRRAIDPDTKSQYSSIFASAHIKNADKIIDKDSDMYGETEKLGVKAKDDHTLVVTLSMATPQQYFYSFMQLATFYPLKKEFVEKQGEDYAQEPENLLYSGPFKMKSWDHGEGWTLVKNDKYWDADKITLDKVTYKIVRDKNTALKLYEDGKIDYTTIGAENTDKYEGDKEFTKRTSSAVSYWDLNRDKVSAFKNKKVRQAMWLSMNRKAAADVLLNDGSKPANYLVPQSFARGPNGKMFHKTGEAQLDNYPSHDKEKAKKLWKEAKDELGIKDLNVSMSISTKEKSEDEAEYFVNQITENLAGFNIEIKKLPDKSKHKEDVNGECEICADKGWGPDYADPMTFLELETSDNPNNTYGISDKKYDNMIAKAKDMGDQPEKRWELLQKADKYMADNAMYIPTFQSGNATLYKSYVKDKKLRKNGIGPTNFYRYAKILKHD